MKIQEIEVVIHIDDGKGENLEGTVRFQGKGAIKAIMTSDQLLSDFVLDVINETLKRVEDNGDFDISEN